MSGSALGNLLEQYGLDDIDWSDFFSYDLEQNGYQENPPDILYKYLSPGNFAKFCTTRTLRVSQKSVLNDVFEFRGRAKSVIDERFKSGISRALRLIFRRLIDRPDFLFAMLKQTAIQNRIFITPDQSALLGHMVLNPRLKAQIQDFINSKISDIEVLIAQNIERLADLLNNSFAIEDMLRGVGMLCLAERPLNQPMWAHYAEGEKGAVVGIRTSSTRFFRPPSTPVPGASILGRVRYSDDIAECIFDDVYSVFLNKSLDWSYEREWRGIYKLEETSIVGSDPAGSDIHVIEFDVSDIAEIYFGYNFDIETSMERLVPLIAAGVSARTCYVSGYSVEGLVAEHCVEG
ncbi:DUF2971 domain-containing protein [Phreatobacter sp. HK31-P]